MAEILHKDISYKIVGVLFKVFNTLGYGYREQYYQRAIEEELTRTGIQFSREVEVPLEYNGKIVGKYRLDFVITDKVVLELKISSRFYPQDSKQIYSYLKATNIRLGILALITPYGIRYRRIIFSP